MKKIYDTMIQVVEKYYWILFAVLMTLIVFFSFWRLDAAYVNSWDEARHGVNAYEMMQNGNYVVNTYGYETDYWNYKPPFSFYGVMLGYKLFGYSVFGMRFYSALCYCIMSLVVGLFVKRYGKLASLFVMAFLAANFRCFEYHMIRSGDADCMYVMFFTFAMLAMFLIPKKKYMLYICGFCFACAFLTKSWHAMMIVAIGGLYLLISGEIKKLSLKQWIFFGLSFLLPLGIWAGVRYSQDGITFLQGMLEYDLLKRTGEGIENHNFPFNYYFEFIFCDDKIYLPALIICFSGILYFSRMFVKKNAGEIAGYICWFLVPFLGFSIAATKLNWYVYPVLIPLFICAAVFMDRFLKDEKLMYSLRFICLCLCLISLARGMKDTYTNIRDLAGDEFQNFLAESVERDSEYAGADAYIELNVPEYPEYWTQCNHLLGELEGDYHCKNGGIQAFLQEEQAVIYLSMDLYEQNKKALADCDVLYQKEQWILLGK